MDKTEIEKLRKIAIAKNGYTKEDFKIDWINAEYGIDSAYEKQFDEDRNQKIWNNSRNRNL